MSASRKTLLVLASTYPRWAADHEPGFVHELAKRLTAQFHVIVLCPHAKGAAQTEVMDSVEVVRYRYAPEFLETLVNDGGIVTNLKMHRWKALLVPGFVLAQAWQAWRLCRTRKVDVIHAHWLIPQGLIAVALHNLPGCKVPFLVTSHGADLYALRSKPLTALKRWVLGRASAATVVSSAMVDEVARIGGDVRKVSVLSMGVDLAKRFVPGDPQKRSANELLFVGRLVEKKGLRYLLAAMPEVLKLRPDVRLKIAGFGPEEEALAEQVRSLSLGHAVQFLGAVPQADLPALYQQAALFVAPFIRAESGDQEGLPVALMEAVACGCPAIAGDVAGLQDIFDDSVRVCIVNPHDSVALKNSILRDLQQREAALHRVAVMRDALLDKLDWTQIAGRYANLLEKIVVD
ncbi:glycosyltransferase family 4 protein [Lampropedia puyangensis]|uniref:Glycosyltransferase family 4 protein n=1 Tax=Lampropedia puyangensis TaxID=1330072 RepID=A0A4S8F7Y1_9BURK|nr:glycosyltransferase [Lampropedia puyangensis]THU03708.1 glycosyltransferase family 4 protein [Lampropedia puyangensis]